MIEGPEHLVQRGKVMVYDMGLLFCVLFSLVVLIGVMSHTMFVENSTPEESPEDVTELSIDFNKNTKPDSKSKRK